MGVIGNIATILSVQRRPRSRGDSKVPLPSEEQHSDCAGSRPTVPTEGISVAECRPTIPTEGVLTQESRALFKWLTHEQRWVLLDPLEQTLSYWGPKKGWVVLDLHTLRTVEYDLKSMRLVLYFEGCSLRFKTSSENEFARWREAISECSSPDH